MVEIRAILKTSSGLGAFFRGLFQIWVVSGIWELLLSQMAKAHQYLQGVTQPANTCYRDRSDQGL